MLGDLGDAGTIDALTEAVALIRELGDDGELSATLSSLAEHELRRNDVSAAARHQRESLHLAAELAMPQVIAGCSIIAARLRRARRIRRDRTPSPTQWRTACSRKIWLRPLPVGSSTERLSQMREPRLRLRLGPERYDILTNEGRQLELHDATALAENVFDLAIARTK